MKILLKKIVQSILWLLAKLTLKKYKPEIISITGSVGKTSTKEAIYSVLSSKWNTRRNIKNYNNEIGVPLTILGLETAGSSVLHWIKNLVKAFVRLFLYQKYPEKLILEWGADKPGDIKYLSKLISCDIAVITSIQPVHLEFFRGIDHIAREKEHILDSLKKKDGIAVLNCDNRYIKEISERTKYRKLTYGFSDEANVKADDVIISCKDILKEDFVYGTSFKVYYKGNTVPIKLNKVLGRHQVYAALAATACGLIFDMNLVEISQALEKYISPPGRLNLLKGIKNTVILDDTYNASPASTKAALKVFQEINTDGRKIAILGDMLELGVYSEQGHIEVGRLIPDICDILVVVGYKAQFIKEGAIEEGMSEDKIFEFDSSQKAGEFIQNKLQKNDVILVKGSQAMRMERAVKEIMAEPEKAEKLLVRQDKMWQKKVKS